MPAESYPVGDMVATVKSREVQRAMLAEMAGDRHAATRHFLAAAHLELVLAEDYTAAGADDLALRSRLSAASCFWRAGRVAQGESLLEELLRNHARESRMIQQVLADLKQSGSAQAS